MERWHTTGSPLEKILMTSSKQRGFSLLELSITLAIGLSIAGIVFVTLQPTLARARMDSGYETAMMVLRDTRHLAVTQNHEYLVVFNPGGFPPGTLLVQYQPPAVGNGPLPPLQLVTTYTIPQDVSFSLKGGFPAAAPDSFGAGGTAIDFGQGLGGGSLNYVAFMPDGSARDTFGNLNSGVVYLSRAAGTLYESHAITVWGATGRIRGWRLVPQGGAPIWVQQ